jgi:VWFA-related protein
MSFRGVAVAAFVLAAGLTLRSAQATNDASEETVRLDAIVTDGRHRPIRDLRAADFEVSDSGSARVIDEVSLQKPTGKRLIALFLDDFHVDGGESTRRARVALHAFIDNQLRPDDLIAVMKPLDPLNSIQMSSDRAALHTAVDAFDGRKADYAPRSPFEEQFMSRAPRSADASRAQVVTSALQALTRRIGEARDGRKAIIMVSDGFTPALPRGSDRLTGAARTIVYAANRFGVSIYPMSPRLNQDGDPADSDADAGRAAMLRMLADQTGGQAAMNEADLGNVLRRAVEDLDEYYVITYRARRGDDGKFHPVALRVKRADAQVRARSGYWAANAALLKPAGVAPRAPLSMRPAHTSPYIRPWIGTSQGPNGLTSISIVWEAGTAPPRNQRVDSVTVRVTAEDGRVVFQDRVRARQRVTFDVAPGSIALEMGLEGVGGSLIDTDVRGVRVPDLRATRPTFATVQLVRTRTARAFAEASADPNPLPSAVREFSRTERLLLRIPVYGPSGSIPDVTAELLNRLGAPMRRLARVDTPSPSGTVQFDLPLASLAPEDYRVELVARIGTQEAREVVLFRIVN